MSVTDVKNFVWCPATLYLKRVLGFREVVTEFMLYGREVEFEKYINFICHSLKCVKILRNLRLRSLKLGVYGVVEYVIITKFGDYVPVDVKWSEVNDKPRKDHVIQIGLYGLLIEDTLNVKVKLCVLYYVTRSGGKTFKIYLTQSLRREILRILSEAKRVLNGYQPKFYPDKNRCLSCGYYQWCPFKT